MFAKCHTDSLSTPNGSKLRLVLLYGQEFLRYWLIFKIAILGHETLLLARVPKHAHTLFSTPGGRGAKLSLFSLYGQPFSRYGQIFKISIFIYIYLYSYKDVHAHTLVTVKLQILIAVNNVFTIVVYNGLLSITLCIDSQ